MEKVCRKKWILFWVLLTTTSLSEGATSQSQISGLELLFNSTNGEYWAWKDEELYGPKWSFSSPQTDPCNVNNTQWQGISCSFISGQSTVISLSLENYQLDGIFPNFFPLLTSLTLLKITNSPSLIGSIPVSIGSLSHLQNLSLSENGLSGLIPSTLAALLHLQEIELSANGFYGTIPSQLSLLSQLTKLDFSLNFLWGNIPSGFRSLSRLKYFDLHTNLLLYGQVLSILVTVSQMEYLDISENYFEESIPLEFDSLSQLEFLDLHSNRFDGHAFSVLGNLSQLQYLDLHSNIFSGSISTEFTSLSKLMYLDVSDNSFNGSIPPEIGTLSQLKLLNFGDNQMNGVIPSELGSLSQLIFCDLSLNSVTGSIPSVFGSFLSMTYLDLGDNNLSKTIPSELGNLSRLEYLDLYSNALTGSLPWQLGSLSRLGLFDLSDNSLSMKIPPTFGSLTALTYLDLSFNFLTGSIPSEFGNLNSLIAWSVKMNQLNGSIPSHLGSLTSLSYVYLASNSLSGTIPVELCNLFQLQALDLSANQMNGTIPSEFSSLHALIDLRLYRNQFRGNLSYFSHLENLKALNLLSNLFSGSIPSQMGNLRGLSVLALSFNSLTGTIPNEIFSLSNLTTLSLTSNLFTGTLPSGFGLLPLISLDLGVNQFSGIIPSEIHFNLLTFFFVSINLLSGTIPFSLTSSTMLRGISLSNNWLNGTLYPEFGSLIHLNDFDVGTNLLTGSIPSDYGSLTQLNNLRLWNNGFTGAIPQQIYSCTSLTFLFLSNNYLTGTIPSELSLLSKLFYLNFRVNALHGYLPSQIGALTDLGYLLLDNNMFQGSIPSTIVSLKHLRSFDCSTNSLTSSFPSVLGSLTDLTFLSLSANSLTGTLPSSLNNLRKLNTLKLYQNRFRGKINFQLESFPQLEQFFIQTNHFHGTLDSFFSNPENSPLSSIVYFDVSDNHFSGSIPANLFRHSNLSIISMSLNCFKDELPSTMCESSRAEVISMTGLGAAHGCSNAVEIPFTGVSLGQILLGSIPECLWLLSNLNTLSLAGNGLTGTISQLASAHSLTSLILSHNYLNGTIPVWIQTKNLTVLDLSRNKLTGDIDHLEFQTENNSTSTNTLELLVNRLSGHVDQSLNRYSYLDILSGNIFSCDNIPSRDENSKYYSCGSTEYGQAMSLAVAIAGLVALTGGFYWIMHLLGMKRTQLPVCCSPWLSRSFSDFEMVVQYMKFYSQAKRSSMMFGSFLFDLMRSFCLLLLLWIVTSLPIYILKILDSSSDDPDYVTYTHLYQWLWSLAFLSGSVPAVLLILMCVISLIGFCIMINHLNSQYPFIPKSSIHSAEESIPIFPHHHRWLVFFTVIINLGVVGTMNGLYLWSTLRDLSTSAQVGIQFGFAFSSLLWTFAVRGLIGTNIKESRYGVWLFLILYLLNSVVIPCVVTALSSPSCYQRILVEPNEIKSTYPFRECTKEQVLTTESYCVEYSPIDMDPLFITPPFTYSYQCIATLLTSYIPVYLYSTSIQFITLWIKYLLIFSTHPNQYPTFLFKLLPGVFWPLHWSTSIHQQPSLVRLIRPSEIMCTTFNHLIIFVTFGFCSPVLGCYIVLFICTNLCFWIIMVGRFLKLRSNVSTVKLDNNDHAETLSPVLTSNQIDLVDEKDPSRTGNLLVDEFIELLNEQIEPITNYITVCKRPVVVASCLFITLLCWEMVADVDGFNGSVWVPLTGLSMVIFIWMTDRWFIQGMVACSLFEIALRNMSLCFKSQTSTSPHPAVGNEDSSRVTVEFSRPSQSSRLSQYSTRESVDDQLNCPDDELESKG